ncbi:adenylyltransferase/cytidyltransferase family protein [Candidatus Woesearchaeota archaeon]|nr:adenylyltransferase/cytidyltransferase family protein [Candidatus Woesearchaeota archaeon]
MVRVMAFGTFDLFHQGHRYYLQQAKSYGDELMVVIARDDTVKKIKGFLPKQSEQERKKAVEASEIPTKVVLGNKEDLLTVIGEYKPDVICLGYDQQSNNVEEYIMQNNLPILIKRIPSFKPDEYKSSKFRQSNSP